MDEKDFMFISRPLTQKEGEAFGKFLKSRKRPGKAKAKPTEKQKTP